MRNVLPATVELTPLWDGRSDWTSGAFAWSPYGTRIAYTTPGLDAGLYIANLDRNRTDTGERDRRFDGRRCCTFVVTGRNAHRLLALRVEG